jgi:hypothetical protein
LAASGFGGWPLSLAVGDRRDTEAQLENILLPANADVAGIDSGFKRNRLPAHCPKKLQWGEVGRGKDLAYS